jgi:aconitate hydratase
MRLSLSYKLLATHLVSGKLSAGQEIGIRIDQTLTQDATGTMAYLQFETLGIASVRTELSVSYIDHNTLQIGYENADDQAYLASVARKYGARLSRAGNGICHQVHIERFGAPGKTLLGSDSHTPTGGGIGMLAMGAGGLDVALAMAGEPFYLTCPTVARVHLTGSLKPWVSAKDIALEVLRRKGTHGNVGLVFEYAGPGLAGLSVPERATVANMGAECGVTTSIFPSDESTRAFLVSQDRGEAWVTLAADDEARYDETIEIDLSRLEPLAALPHSPGNVKTVAEIAGARVDQVCIGSCTNSSYKDLATAARALEGRRSAASVSFVITPGSKQVLRSLARDGLLDSFLAAGARIVEPSCGFCIGNGHSPKSGAVSLRTSNRNFEGRSGTADAGVYIVSPETAVVSAVAGVITDPRTAGLPYPGVDLLAAPVIDDSMIEVPLALSERAGVEIVRGPNIGRPPTARPLPASIHGVASIKVGDKITTDHIIPAGARMKYRSNIEAYSAFVFERVDPTFAGRAAANRDAGLEGFIIAGLSYGQGSSREHAAICPAHLGVRVALAKSFERIHAANLVNFGVLPLVFMDESDYEAIEQGDALAIADVRKQLSSGGVVEVRNETRGLVVRARHELTERQAAILSAGGALAYAKRSAGGQA